MLQHGHVLHSWKGWLYTGSQCHNQVPQGGSSWLSDKPVALHCPRVAGHLSGFLPNAIELSPFSMATRIWCGHREFCEPRELPPQNSARAILRPVALILGKEPPPPSLGGVPEAEGPLARPGVAVEDLRRCRRRKSCEALSIA